MFLGQFFREASASSKMRESVSKSLMIGIRERKHTLYLVNISVSISAACSIHRKEKRGSGSFFFENLHLTRETWSESSQKSTLLSVSLSSPSPSVPHHPSSSHLIEHPPSHSRTGTTIFVRFDPNLSPVKSPRLNLSLRRTNNKQGNKLDI